MNIFKISRSYEVYRCMQAVALINDTCDEWYNWRLVVPIQVLQVLFSSSLEIMRLWDVLGWEAPIEWWKAGPVLSPAVSAYKMARM